MKVLLRLDESAPIHGKLINSTKHKILPTDELIKKRLTFIFVGIYVTPPLDYNSAVWYTAETELRLCYSENRPDGKDFVCILNFSAEDIIFIWEAFHFLVYTK